MSSTPINLFAPWDPSDITDAADIQAVIDYCASRLRAILIARAPTAVPHHIWLDQGLVVELVSLCTLAASCD
jgi:hypothetical protein